MMEDEGITVRDLLKAFECDLEAKWISERGRIVHQLYVGDINMRHLIMKERPGVVYILVKKIIIKGSNV
jgi:hypothetical protein